MTNAEYYKDEIWKIACKGDKIAKSNDKIYACHKINCFYCDFNISGGCGKAIEEWCNKEFIETDWSKVEVDTPIYVKDNSSKNWNKRYFAKYYNGNVYAFKDGKTSWTSIENDICCWKYAKLAYEK